MIMSRVFIFGWTYPLRVIAPFLMLLYDYGYILFIPKFIHSYFESNLSAKLWCRTLTTTVVVCLCSVGMWDNTPSRRFDPPAEEIQLWLQSQALRQAFLQSGHPPNFTHGGMLFFNFSLSSWFVSIEYFFINVCDFVPFPSPQNCTYDLYALVNHFGDLTGGHYTAQIKSFETEAWYHFNDDVVERVRRLSFLHAAQFHKFLTQ